MPVFAVSLRLPGTFTEDFLATIPAHRAFINQLLSAHIIESYAVSADRARSWIIMHGDDEPAIRNIVEQFPLHPYLHSIEIDELLFFDSAASRFPHISLN